MSSRLCNYCLYRALLREYGEDRVTTKPKPFAGFEKGVDVFVDGKWIAWYAELPTKCAD